jgi:hypothetical protein
MAISLPKAVEAYFDASNAQDADAMAKAFAANAIVYDEGKMHRGRAEIGVWARDTIRKYQTALTPLGINGDDGSAAVRTKVSGTFPGSPIELTFNFEISDEGISSLKIG